MTPTRILLIEDDQTDIQLVRMALNGLALIGIDWPLEVTVAEDGQEAMTVLENASTDGALKADFIVLDLNIPRRDGAEVLRFIRKSEALKHLPVAILSSLPRDVIESRLKAVGACANCYVTKPIGVDEFLKIGPVLLNCYQEHLKQADKSKSASIGED